MSGYVAYLGSTRIAVLCEKSLLSSRFWYCLRRNRILAAPAVACRQAVFASDLTKTRVVARVAANTIRVLLS